jgi:hypothetical protein
MQGDDQSTSIQRKAKQHLCAEGSNNTIFLGRGLMRLQLSRDCDGGDGDNDDNDYHVQYHHQY